jgi:hypothetical protein
MPIRVESFVKNEEGFYADCIGCTADCSKCPMLLEASSRIQANKLRISRLKVAGMTKRQRNKYNAIEARRNKSKMIRFS